ncbi:unnamed protein product [Closterium sp. Naga37s-1]|nr:unnamed protein product [Closterium sp. Naga37s-1]
MGLRVRGGGASSRRRYLLRECRAAEGERIIPYLFQSFPWAFFPQPHSLVTLSDLQHDYINPHDSAASINRFLLPDMLAHAAVALLLLLFPPSLLGLLLFALNVPLLLFHARCLLAGSYTVDVTEVFVQLPELRRLWQKKVALYCILVLPVVYRWVIAATHLLVITSQPKAVRRTA